MKGFFALDLDVIQLGTGRRGSRWGAAVVPAYEVNVKPKAQAKKKEESIERFMSKKPVPCAATPEPRSQRLTQHLANPGTVDSSDSTDTLPLPGNTSIVWSSPSGSPSVWDSPSALLMETSKDEVSSPEFLKKVGAEEREQDGLSLRRGLLF